METVIALLAFAFSIFTLWLTHGHKGKITMTRPTIVAFAFEGMRPTEPKIFLRTLIRSSSKQGVIVESMFIKATVNGSPQSFTSWAYGDNGIVRGSGLFVGEQGVEMYHHFIVPKNVQNYNFVSGKYDIGIFCVVREKKKKMYQFQIDLPAELTENLNRGVLGVYFDWNPETDQYFASPEPISAGKAARLLS